MVFRITARTVLIQLLGLAIKLVMAVLAVVYFVAFKSADAGHALIFYVDIDACSFC